MCIIFFGVDIMNDEEYMKLAIKEAKKAFLNDEIPVGAIIVKNEKIIARAYNKRNKTNQIIDHAEIIAIKKANKKLNNWRLDDCTIYVTLEPCPMCASAIEQSRIKKIVTGASNKNYEIKKITDKILKKIDYQKNVCDLECSSLIDSFFYNKRKQK